MIKASKRLISVLVCLTLVLAMLPMAVFAADTVTVYYYNATNWEKVAVHYWDTAAGDTTWPGKAMENLGNGYWKAEVPADIGGIIFNNNNKGAQTGNLQLPTDGKNCFTGSEWITYTGESIEVVIDYYLRGGMNNWTATEDNKMTDNGDGTYSITMKLEAGTYEYKGAVADWSWSCPSGANAKITLEADDTVTFTLNPAKSTLTYTLASGAAKVDYYLRGITSWDATDANKMTDNGDGTYSITFALEAGSYEYKAAVADWSWSCPAEGNAQLKLDADCEVTFTLDLAANEVYVEGDGIGEVDPMVIESITAVGAGKGGFLNDEEWSEKSTSNIMTEDDGVYTITYTGVAAGEYEFKFAANGAWTYSWGAGITVESGVEHEVGFNGGNGIVVVAKDDSTVTLVLDLTGMDSVTGAGAKSTVTVVAPEGGDEGGGEAGGETDPVEMEIEYIVAVGTGLGGFLNDITWDPAASANMMTESDGVYTITYTGVVAGTYEFKFAANGAWDYSWGNAVAFESGVENEVYFNGQNCIIELAGESDVTLTLDLTNMDMVTGEGAKCVVTVEAVEDEPVVDDGTKDIKFQTKDNSLRLVTWVDSLDYKEIVFNVTIGGQTAAIPCTTVYSSINAGGLKLDSAAAVFNEDALYFVTYTINNIPASVTEFEVSVTWTDLEGNTRTSGTRTITL